MKPRGSEALEQCWELAHLSLDHAGPSMYTVCPTPRPHFETARDTAKLTEAKLLNSSRLTESWVQIFQIHRCLFAAQEKWGLVKLFKRN